MPSVTQWGQLWLQPRPWGVLEVLDLSADSSSWGTRGGSLERAHGGDNGEDVALPCGLPGAPGDGRLSPESCEPSPCCQLHEMHLSTQEVLQVHGQQVKHYQPPPE